MDDPFDWNHAHRELGPVQAPAHSDRQRTERVSPNRFDPHRHAAAPAQPPRSRFAVADKVRSSQCAWRAHRSSPPLPPLRLRLRRESRCCRFLGSSKHVHASHRKLYGLHYGGCRVVILPSPPIFYVGVYSRDSDALTFPAPRGKLSLSRSILRARWQQNERGLKVAFDRRSYP